MHGWQLMLKHQKQKVSATEKTKIRQYAENLQQRHLDSEGV